MPDRRRRLQSLCDGLYIGKSRVAQLLGDEAAVGVARRRPAERAGTRVAQALPQPIIENARPARINCAFQGW
jgi:hypothetical protein